jgi:hypothetical protein
VLSGEPDHSLLWLLRFRPPDKTSGSEGIHADCYRKGLEQRDRHYCESGFVLAVCGLALIRALDHGVDTLWLPHRFDHFGYLAGQFFSESANDAQ